MSYPYKIFKQIDGHANHFLVTLLVGVEAVRDGSATKGPSFSTTWNPRDRVRSADRSREFAIAGAMAAATDALDAYVRYLTKDPTPLETALNQTLQGMGRDRLAQRLRAVQPKGNATEIEMSLITLLIAWRNSLVHSVGDIDLDETTREFLIESSEAIFEGFRGLRIEQTLSTFDRHGGKQPPSFKDVASFTAAAHEFVRKADMDLIRRCDPYEYYLGYLHDFTKGDALKLSNLWGKTPRKTESMLRNHARQAGFSDATPDSNSAIIDEETSLAVRLGVAGPTNQNE